MISPLLVPPRTNVAGKDLVIILDILADEWKHLSSLIGCQGRDIKVAMPKALRIIVSVLLMTL